MKKLARLTALLLTGALLLVLTACGCRDRAAGKAAAAEGDQQLPRKHPS